MTRIVVDPVTRIEGHLRIEATLDGGTITDAISSGTMWRGLEVILKGRDPREAWAFTERICGVCTTVHALASVRCVENALGITVPQNADLIRNIMFLTQMVQDHVVHFYHLHAMDWIDVPAALLANPSSAAALQRSISPTWPNSSSIYFATVQATLKKFVDSGQLGIFQNAYWGHPAYRLPAEANLLAFAHYLEALQWQKEIVKIHASFGGKNPHPNYLVGGMPCSFATATTTSSSTTLTIAKLTELRTIVQNAIDLVQGMYIPDLLLIAGKYPDWRYFGGGLGNFMAYGDVPQNGINNPGQFRFPQGVVLNRNLRSTSPLNLADSAQIREGVGHSWYVYPEGITDLHPYDGLTQPRYDGPAPPYSNLDGNNKYSWVKAPRWRGIPMEVGPLARVVVGYASRRQEFRDVVGRALGYLHWDVSSLFSTIGRTLARGLETSLCAQWLIAELDKLIANVSAGVTATANTALWDPSTWPKTPVKGFGFTEAPRGALGHWIQIADGKIANYQIVVPSTWNASPKDGRGQRGAYESALMGTRMMTADQPLEILRTIHSFDPCLACATHVMTPDGRTLAEVKVV
ncbi:MAG TPA: nickel-dependent hydrogenase large subunit [Acidobacteriota bacterium]|nr:nickel-dependent hydrogenase large subunit [Acidobacteriota bacterium]